VQYSASGNETVALNMSMIAAMANCETRITRLTLNVVDPLPKITGARISSREVHPLQPVLLTLSGHGLRADDVYSDTLFVVSDSVACTLDVNAASPLVLAAVSGPFPSSGTSSLNRHTVNITFNLTSTGTHRLCWRFNRTGAVVDVSAAGAGIVFSHAFVTLWRITPTANAGETITLTVEGQGLFPYVGQDALRMRRATSARDADCERVSDPTVVDLPFVADGSTPTDLVTVNMTFAASGRLLVCYNASRSIGRRYTLLGAVVVRPVALSLTPSKVEPDEATTLNLVGFGLDARTPRGNETNTPRV
jgi:hypothetical protein